MIILRYSYSKFWTVGNILILQADIYIYILYLWILWIKSKEKIISFDDTTHCLLYGKWTEKILMLSTVMRTVIELRETANVTIWTMFFRRTVASFIGVSSAFWKRHFALLWFSTSYLQRHDFQYQKWGTHGPKVQQKQSASPLECDAEEQQVPPSSPN
jgi:hypothetical protein